MKRMGAVESDSVKSARKAKDKLHKACERASETRERTLHGQEQNNAHGKHERVMRQWSISSQHTCTIHMHCCTEGLAFHSSVPFIELDLVCGIIFSQSDPTAAILSTVCFCASTIWGWHLFLWKTCTNSWPRYVWAIKLGLWLCAEPLPWPVAITMLSRHSTSRQLATMWELWVHSFSLPVSHRTLVSRQDLLVILLTWV